MGLAAPVAARDGADAPGALAARLAGIIDRARFGTASPANADTPIGAVVDVWDRLSLDTRRAACSLGRARLVRVASRRPIDAITRPDDENDAGRALGVGRLAQNLDAFELLPWLAGCITRAAREPGAIADQAAARLLARFGVQDLGLSDTDLGPDVFAWGAPGRTLATSTRPPRRTWEQIEPVLRLVCAGSPARSTAGVLLALLQAAPREVGAAWRAALRDAASHSTPAAQLIAQTIQRSAIPCLRAEALRWLDHGAIARAARSRALTTDGSAEHAAALRAAHVLTHPKRTVALTRSAGEPVRIGAKGWPGPGEAPTTIDPTGGPSVRASVRWAASLAPTPEAIDAAIAPALESADPCARALAASAAGGVRVREFCFDPEPAVARVAIHRWTGVQRPSRHAAGDRVRLAQRLARSPHTAVRSAAHVELQLHDPLAHPGAIARLELRRRMQADVGVVVTMLREALGGTDERRRLQAAVACRVLRLEGVPSAPQS
ncbi:MAG: hypothetical protein AAF995_04925, partial [Planctomycetota bacterium]